MKKIAFVLSTAVSTLLLATPAIANSGFYAELSAGSVKNKAGVSAVYTTTSFSETKNETENDPKAFSEGSTSFGLRLGYKFNNYVALELGHHQYGESTDNYVDDFGDTINDKVDSSSTSVGIKGMLPLTDELSLFARAGMAKWNFKASSTDSSIPDEQEAPVKENGNDIYYGAGVEYRFTDTISLGIEYSVLNMGWELSESGTYEDFSYTAESKVNYKVENIALLLKISF